jgi:hypothetical protein
MGHELRQRHHRGGGCRAGARTGDPGPGGIRVGRLDVDAAQSRVKFEFQQLPDSTGSNFGCCLFCDRQGADDLKLLSDFLTSHLNFSLQDTFVLLFR